MSDSQMFAVIKMNHSRLSTFFQYKQFNDMHQKMQGYRISASILHCSPMYAFILMYYVQDLLHVRYSEILLHYLVLVRTGGVWGSHFVKGYVIKLYLCVTTEVFQKNVFYDVKILIT